jgi:hypothetical protein
MTPVGHDQFISPDERSEIRGERRCAHAGYKID